MNVSVSVNGRDLGFFWFFFFDLGLRRQMEQAMEQAYEQALAFQRACVFALAAALGPVVLCWLAWMDGASDLRPPHPRHAYLSIQNTSSPRSSVSSINSVYRINAPPDTNHVINDSSSPLKPRVHMIPRLNRKGVFHYNG